jgi:hypothetical protein
VRLTHAESLELARFEKWKVVLPIACVFAG